MRYDVIFVGSRGGAIRAAKKLGFRVHLIDKKKPTAFVRNSLHSFSLVESLRDNQKVVAAFEDSEAKSSTHFTPVAVCALTEDAVVSSACLREKLGLKGMLPKQAALFQNKAQMKKAVTAAGMPCTAWKVIQAGDTAEGLASEFGLPAVVKEVSSSGSRGTVIAQDLETLKANVRPGCLVEKFISGLEMSIETLVEDGRIIFTNTTEYYINQWANVVPAELTDDRLKKVLEYNQRVIQALEVKNGITHLEFYITDQGIVFGEIAARPPGGYLMELIQLSYGFNPWKTWLQTEVGIEVGTAILDQHARNTQVSGVLLFHPGQGTVKRIDGLKWAHQQKVEKFSMRLSDGDRVEVREGTGQNKGEVIVTGKTRAEVVEKLEDFKKRVVILLK